MNPLTTKAELPGSLSVSDVRGDINANGFFWCEVNVLAGDVADQFRAELVRRWNSHEEMVKAMERAIALADALQSKKDKNRHDCSIAAGAFGVSEILRGYLATHHP